MSNSFFAIYKMPEDAAHFDEHYKGHMDIVNQMPGLKEARVNKVVKQLAGDPELYIVTELVFDSAEDLQAAMGSDPGKQSAKDLASWGGTASVSAMLFTERMS